MLTPQLKEGFQRRVLGGFADKIEDLLGEIATQTPLGRIADPEEIAATAYLP